MNRLGIILIVCIYVVSLSCEGKQVVGVQESSANSIKQVSLVGQKGVLNGSFIDFNIPAGIDISHVVPKFVLEEGVTLSPSPNIPQNFSHFIQYTVSSKATKLNRHYVLRAYQLPYDKADVESFSDGVHRVVIKDDEIRIYLESKEKAGVVIPKITTSYKSLISPASGEAINLAVPPVYTVLAENKTKQKRYQVKIVRKYFELADNGITVRVREGVKEHIPDGYTELLNGKVYRMVYNQSLRRLAHLKYSDTLSSIVTTYVTDMSQLFMDRKEFNQNLSHWDVSSVKNMSEMFKNASSFDQSIDIWDVSAVTNMSKMFQGAIKFSGSLVKWNVASVENMSEMFYRAHSFNGELSNWNVGRVKDMFSMFREAPLFNGKISRWNVGHVENMAQMFYGATAFNQDLNSWNTSKVNDMEGMFTEAINFNGNITNWNVSSVVDMKAMFKDASSFNQDIGNWNVSNVKEMGFMFLNTSKFNKNLNKWCVIHIHSLPEYFGFNRKDANLPNWGTCPE